MQAKSSLEHNSNFSFHLQGMKNFEFIHTHTYMNFIRVRRWYFTNKANKLVMYFM